MSEPEPVEVRDQIPVVPRAAANHSRAMGSPLSMGASNRQPVSSQQGTVNRLSSSSSAPGRALPGGTSTDESSSVQRAIHLFRAALPIVQRLLPLLDGNIATAVAGLVAPRPHPQPAPPAPKVDLVPLEEGLAELQTQHQSLREQVIEQNTSLKRVEDQLEMVREATDRNTLEQQELLEDLKSFSYKVRIVAAIVLGLLAISIVINLFLFTRLQRLLP
jgi:hypothetical protein